MIEINNLTTNPVDEDFLEKIAEIVLESEPAFAKATAGKGERLDLSIALIGPGRMRKLNKRYLGKNQATDVLAFGQNQKSKIKNQKFPIPLENGLGEVVICLREVKKNAKRFGESFEKELAICLIHGILHLLGYDHEKNEKEAEKMEAKQKTYLNQL